jgi:hypothetical protein
MAQQRGIQVLLHQVRQALDIALAQGVVIHPAHPATRPSAAAHCTLPGSRTAVQIGAEDLPVALCAPSQRPSSSARRFSRAGPDVTPAWISYR